MCFAAIAVALVHSLRSKFFREAGGACVCAVNIMRVLGIDYGDSKIGVAVSDMLGWMAQGVETIRWKEDLQAPIDRIVQLVKQYEVEKIVVGYPKNTNGTIGPRAEKTQEFIDQLKNSIDIEIVKWNEWLTTAAANRMMHETGVKTSRKKHVEDQIAASLILQGYLDSVRR